MILTSSNVDVISKFRVTFFSTEYFRKFSGSWIWNDQKTLQGCPLPKFYYFLHDKLFFNISTAT
jgi:hypothetical protein